MGDAIVLGHDDEHLELLGASCARHELRLSVQIATMGEHVEHSVCRDSRVRVANNSNQEVEEDSAARHVPAKICSVHDAADSASAASGGGVEFEVESQKQELLNFRFGSWQLAVGSGS